MMLTRAVGPISMTVCSPASRRGASLRPRFAGVTALTPAARTVPAGPARQPGTLRLESPTTDVLTETGWSLFTWPRWSFVSVAISRRHRGRVPRLDGGRCRRRHDRVRQPRRDATVSPAHALRALARGPADRRPRTRRRLRAGPGPGGSRTGSLGPNSGSAARRARAAAPAPVRPARPPAGAHAGQRARLFRPAVPGPAGDSRRVARRRAHRPRPAAGHDAPQGTAATMCSPWKRRASAEALRTQCVTSVSANGNGP